MAIKTGDLVVVVRGHECDLGNIFRVSKMMSAPSGHWHCLQCRWGAWSDDVGCFRDGPGGYGAPLSWLRKIDPLDELEKTEREEEITT